MRKINQESAVRIPRSRRRAPLRPPRWERRAPGRLHLGPGGAEFGLRRALPGQGVWEESGGDPRRRRRSRDVPKREISHSGRATRSHAPRRLRSASTGFTRPRSLHLGATLGASARLSPILSTVRPLLQARPWVPFAACSPDATDSGRARAPCSPDPEPADGGNAAARRAPKLRWQRAAWKPGDSLLSARSLRHLVPTCQRPRSPTPLPTRVAEVCNLQPSPRRGSVLGSRDSPPGCGRRCPVPGGSRLPAAGSCEGEPGGLAAGLGMGRPRRNGPRPSLAAPVQPRPGPEPATLGFRQQPPDAPPTRPAQRSWAQAAALALQLAPDQARG